MSPSTAGATSTRVMADLWSYDQHYRNEAGPPGDYDPDRLRRGQRLLLPGADVARSCAGRLGDETFWRLVQEWPRSEAFGNADRDRVVRLVGGADRRGPGPFFDAWLLGDTTPDRGL